ncbi:inter-alpha-trypsin inhibitor heavy chain H4-like isoform X2 [Zophobas morio]|uniref:inter-alpha-trypsin inhibitor heavy chain H4-like isoform X2 n=1 Tax=Zophobas morio TaxID=2755281 RepID=UPI0030833E5D
MYCRMFFLLFFCHSIVFTESKNFVVRSTDAIKEEKTNVSNVNPQIYSMQIFANVSNRFARTLITSKVRNSESTAHETTFSVVLPDNAFISEFEMEIEGKIYKAYVKEKEEAKKIYQEAVSSGQSAAHVEQSTRDSKIFTVSVNIEPESKTIFRLAYEELLQRQFGRYELVINIHPGQLVEDLGVEVHINESRPLTYQSVPFLQTGNEISKNQEKLNDFVEINSIDNKSICVKFTPDIEHQLEFAKSLGGTKESGLAGQFVVQYDVERDPQGGEVLVRDGYFVHFFAPSELQPLPKHVVFVLDHSGSMIGRKFEQVVEAMKNILSDLISKDLFDIVWFSEGASVWNVATNTFMDANISNLHSDYGHLEPHLRETNLPEGASVSDENIDKAKNAIENYADMGATNIIGGLEVGLFLIKRTQEKFPDKYQPILIFLTDGLPNVGIHSGDEIITLVSKLNEGTNRAPIFSLSFGEDADKDFLRKLSSQNLGFSRHIYEAADASLQLHNFYRTISLPLLSDVTFKYVDEVSDVTEVHYPLLFNGSELVVAGRAPENLDVLLNVTGRCTAGPVNFHTVQSRSVSSLERLWAYLTVKQMLQETDRATNTTELTKKALELSLKYSFVTPVSSLVVVKPNATDSVDTKSAGPQPRADESTYSYSILRKSQFSTTFQPSRMLYAVNLAATYDSEDFVDYDAIPSIPAAAPQWLSNLRDNNQNITTAEGTFTLRTSGGDLPHPECPKTPFNGTGVCMFVFDCPQVFSFLDDLNVYLKYFCPLNEYAGVCCPK